jgi:hypothetical protein
MPTLQAVSTETLIPLLKDLPTLLMQATSAERRAVVRELVTHASRLPYHLVGGGSIPTYPLQLKG